jgi:predicted nucleic acid-binding Zn ribbon protein
MEDERGEEGRKREKRRQNTSLNLFLIKAIRLLIFLFLLSLFFPPFFLVGFVVCG